MEQGLPVAKGYVEYFKAQKSKNLKSIVASASLGAQRPEAIHLCCQISIRDLPNTAKPKIVVGGLDLENNHV